MAEDQYNSQQVGVEFQLSDADLIGQVSGLADDRLLAEILRLIPFDGTVYAKMILPFGFSYPPTIIYSGATVRTSGANDASILVSPFRAVVGPRTAMAVGSELANWRDIRSGIFVPSGGVSSQKIALAPNASGQGRWDLIYATYQVDLSAGVKTLRIKDPTSGAVTASPQASKLSQNVTISVLQGTPGAPAVIPTIPADNPGGTPATFNFPLAAIGLPNGFTNVTGIPSTWIRDQAIARGMGPEAFGGVRLRPATGNNDIGGAYAGGDSWTVGGAYPHWPRPPAFIPPQMLGGEQLLVAIDFINGSHADQAIIDGMVDWRQRYFTTFAMAGNTGTTKFANDPTNATSNMVPIPPGVGVTGQDWQMGQSFFADNNGFTTQAASVFLGTSARFNSFINGGSTVNLYVDMSTGLLKMHFTGTPAADVFFWIMASSPFPNR